MGNIEFIKKRVKEYSNLGELDWRAAYEINSKEYLESTFEDFEFSYIVDGEKNIDGIKSKIKFKNNIIYDVDADFEYFTYYQITHDGSLIFIDYATIHCLEKIIFAETYNKTKPEPSNNSNIIYTIGNLVVVNEHGKKFATAEKPWCVSRTTVFLPIKYEIEENIDE